MSPRALTAKLVLCRRSNHRAGIQTENPFCLEFFYMKPMHKAMSIMLWPLKYQMLKYFSSIKFTCEGANPRNDKFSKLLHHIFEITLTSSGLMQLYIDR